MMFLKCKDWLVFCIAHQAQSMFSVFEAIIRIIIVTLKKKWRGRFTPFLNVISPYLKLSCRKSMCQIDILPQT